MSERLFLAYLSSILCLFYHIHPTAHRTQYKAWINLQNIFNTYNCFFQLQTFISFGLETLSAHLALKQSVNECVTSGQVWITNNYDLQKHFSELSICTNSPTKHNSHCIIQDTFSKHQSIQIYIYMEVIENCQYCKRICRWNQGTKI